MSLSISTQALSIQQSKVTKYLIYFWGPIFQTNNKMAMISTKKLIKMARRWQKFAAMQRKRISFSRTGSNEDNCSTRSSSIVEKGHLAVYTADQARFTIPLAYLETEIIKQLLNILKEVFGLPSDGPITLSCDSAFDYIILLIKKGKADGDLHKALLLSIPSYLHKALLLSIPSCCCSTSSLLPSCCCSTSSLHQQSGTQQLSHNQHFFIT